MRGIVTVGIAALAGAHVALASTPAFAQATFDNVQPGQHCQTVRECNFRRGGVYRGCISAYSCRRCRVRRARCNVGDRRRKCYRVVCPWAGT